MIINDLTPLLAFAQLLLIGYAFSSSCGADNSFSETGTTRLETKLVILFH